LASVRETAHAAGPDVRVGGQPASTADFIDAVYGSFPLMIALIALTTFILLARAFRSLLLPAKAILLNILSVAAGWGALVLIWQKGYGSELIWDIEATSSIPSWIPVIAFAFLYGLSMDYEVFILSRMREERHRTHRAPRDERGADSLPRLHRDGLRARHRAQDDRHRACSRHPARRDRDPRTGRPCGHRAHGPLELVAPHVAGAGASGTALAATENGRSRRRGVKLRGAPKGFAAA
jgi:hypothetical protein